MSCASPPLVQPQVNSLVAAQRFDYALNILENSEESYGPNNELLFMMDYGMVLHAAGRYKESISAFERAKQIYDKLYTISVTKQFKTWLVNDYFAPYRGEDFERVMVNVFQALNFAALGDIEEALVEARDVDVQLSTINRQYKSGQKNTYKEDAFARLLMGILYEDMGTPEGFNDAFISYRKALEVYEDNYYPDYGTHVPDLLKENLLATSKFMGPDEFHTFKNKFKGAKFLDLKEKGKRAEVYLFYYHGLSPIKHQIALPIPLSNGIVGKLAFPVYNKRKTKFEPGMFKAINDSDQEFTTQTQQGQDITAIALQSLDNRRVRVYAKAGIRAASKVLLEKQIQEQIGSDTGSDVFGYVASLYNLSSEQADLRSWQTLPAEIRVARLFLEPGEYRFSFDGVDLGVASIRAGEKKYFLYRTRK